MKIFRIHNHQEYRSFMLRAGDGIKSHQEYLSALVPNTEREFFVDGYSYTGEKLVHFVCDFKCGRGYPNVNWRERVVCPVTGLNNRMRAAIHFFDLFSNTHEASRVYIMEQTTPVYTYLKSRQVDLTGSEYLGSAVPFGSTNKQGIRNEDATRLSFESKSIDAILSFDVFEHVYNYKLAFTECARVLRNDGCMIFTVPFALNSSGNIERSVVNSQG